MNQNNVVTLKKHKGASKWDLMAIAFTNLEAAQISPVVFIARLRNISFEIDSLRLRHLDNLILSFGRESWLMFFAELSEESINVGAKEDFCP